MVARHPAIDQREELGELVDEVVGRGVAPVALKRDHRHRVGAGGAAEAELDPLGVQPGERAEHLGHLQRAVVRQHHAAAAHANRLRGRRDRADEHLRRRACQRRRGVVLRQPVALVAERLRVAGEVDGVRERLSARGALGDRGLVQNA